MSEAKQHLQAEDPVLKQLICDIPLKKIEGNFTVFHDLMSCVIEQQIHYRSSKKTFEKMLSKAGIQLLHPDNFHVFEERALKGQKLSVRKLETMSNVLNFWEKNKIFWDTLSDYEIRKTVQQIKGIGNWTIDMILMYSLKRPDVFACDDYHIKQIMIQLYGLNTHNRLRVQIKNLSEAWSPYKSTAFRYLLAYKQLYNSNEHL